MGLSLPLAAQMHSTTVTIPVPVTAPEFQVLPDYGSGNARANQLRTAPEKDYTFDRASLRDVLRYLAYESGIQYVALQESSAAESTLITFTLRSSPFRALETIANANGISLFFENGVWFLRPINEKELIARTYKLKYNPQQRIKYEPEGTNSNQQQASGGGSNPGMNIDIQGATNVFKTETPEIVDQIKTMLGIVTTGINGQQISSEVTGSINLTPSAMTPPGGSRFLDTAEASAGGNQVVYNADSTTIYVIATRQQHQWVEGLLSAADRPQELISIEVKFFETNKNPFQELGINWANTLKGGYGVTLSGGAEVRGGLNSNMINQGLNTFNNLTTSGSQTGVNSGGGGPYNFSSGETSTGRTSDKNNTKQTEFSGGYSAVLAPDALSLSLQAFEGDNGTTLVSYPRVLTLNNREVVIRSVRNQPVLSGVSSVTAGTGTTASSVSYIPIGTIINILPKTMPDGSVILNVAITISEQISSVPIDQQGNTNDYPVVASRVFNAALQINSGYTLAIGGLERTRDNNGKNGVPFLKDIPGVGELFKSKTRSREKENLIFFITPVIIQDRSHTEGISETPSAVIPLRPGDPVPPSFSPEGRLVGGEKAIDSALQWLTWRAKYFQQINRENRTDRTSIEQLRSLINLGNMIFAEIQRLQTEYPDRVLKLVGQEERTLAVLKNLDTIYRAAEKNRF